MVDRSKQARGKHILVVNDTEEILDLFRSILEGLGHRMTAWSFSPDDLAKVTEVKPDLVILDVLVGPTELQGWALLQKMRMEPSTESIPIIVCSAATNWVREQEGWLAAKGVKVVLKPFGVNDLEHAIGQALSLPEVMATSTMPNDAGGATTPSGKVPADGTSIEDRPN
ncbi:MAG TPA: response regulator [Vicinamibacterales bacterium]|nr:response regulator [Vicinamibacterales bacterium]